MSKILFHCFTFHIHNSLSLGEWWWGWWWWWFFFSSVWHNMSSSLYIVFLIINHHNNNENNLSTVSHVKKKQTIYCHTHTHNGRNVYVIRYTEKIWNFRFTPYSIVFHSIHYHHHNHNRQTLTPLCLTLPYISVGV